MNGSLHDSFRVSRARGREKGFGGFCMDAMKSILSFKLTLFGTTIRIFLVVREKEKRWKRWESGRDKNVWEIFDVLMDVKEERKK